MGALGTMVTNLVTQAQTTIVIPLVAAGILFGGGAWAIGDHKAGRTQVVAALIGGAIMLLAIEIAGALHA